MLKKNTHWIYPTDVEISPELLEVAGGNNLLAQLLVHRGLAAPQAAKAFLDPQIYQPTSPFELQGMESAVERLFTAIHRGQKIFVWGDFDVDGQTATTLLVQGLQWLGADVGYYIPDRERESHGVNLPALEKLINQGAELVLTCDTGISAVEATAYAAQRDVDILVTDHHDLPNLLPDAYALINPKFLPMDHPLSTLPGVGVAYKLMEALLQRNGKTDQLESLLDLVALGIVADIALQTGDTRYLLQRGIAKLRRTDRLGLLNLMDLAELEPANLTEEHIGYIIAPRLNALGRLDNANLAVELLTTNSSGRARFLASHLEALNGQRKLLTDQVFQGILDQIQRDPGLLDPSVLIFSHPNWPGGVIGIVASRLVERFHKPVILFSAPLEGIARGSARSIPGINITAAIATQADLLYSFGGHPMAAGLSMDTNKISQFHHSIAREVSKASQNLDLDAVINIDAVLSLVDLSLEQVQQLERLSPFGAGNPPLIFASQPLNIRSFKAIGRSQEHLELLLEDEQEQSWRVLWWQGAGWELPKGRFRLAYTVRTTDYLGKPQLQIEWQDAALLEDESLKGIDEGAWEVIDCREDTSPSDKLAVLDLPSDSQIWAEALTPPPPGSRNREQLESGKILIVYTIPPGQTLLREALERVSPEHLYLFAVDPGLDEPKTFLPHLAGLVKFAINEHQGITNLTQIASALGHRSQTIVAGLEWLQARGQLQYTLDHSGNLILHPGTHQDALKPQISQKLKSLLQETRAYRNYYRLADSQSFKDL